jgi:hypothetical protein
MIKKDIPPILKGSGEKPTIHCPHCFVQISHVEVVEERHGTMNIGGRLNTISMRRITGFQDIFVRNARKR